MHLTPDSGSPAEARGPDRGGRGDRLTRWAAAAAGPARRPAAARPRRRTRLVRVAAAPVDGAGRLRRAAGGARPPPRRPPVRAARGPAARCPPPGLPAGAAGTVRRPGYAPPPGDWPPRRVRHPGWRPPPAAPKPGVVPLRPLGLGELLDGAVTYIRRNPRATLGLATVLSVVSAVVQFFVLLAALQSIQGAATGATGSSLEDVTADALLGTTLASNAASLVSVLVSVVVQIVATGVFTVIVGGAVLGQQLSAGEAWRRARPFLWRLLGLTVLSTLAVTAIAVVGILLAVAGRDRAGRRWAS